MFKGKVNPLSVYEPLYFKEKISKVIPSEQQQ